MSLQVVSIAAVDSASPVSVFASVVSDPSVSASEALADAVWSQAHGLAAIESVVARAWPDTPLALAKVWIRPRSEDDREIIVSLVASECSLIKRLQIVLADVMKDGANGKSMAYVNEHFH